MPPSLEKVSPVKKAPRGSSMEGKDGSVDPVVPPQSDPNPKMDLLQKALEKIEELEKQLATKAPMPPTPHSVASTPRTNSARPTSSPTTTSSMATPKRIEEESKSDGEDGQGGEIIHFPNGAGQLSHDALRMRLRRLCTEKPKTKKCHVDTKTQEQYTRGGEDREWLEIALLEALQKVGPDRHLHKKLTVPWFSPIGILVMFDLRFPKFQTNFFLGSWWLTIITQKTYRIDWVW